VIRIGQVTGAQAREDLLEAAIGEDERIAARDDDVAHLGVFADVSEPLLHRRPVEAAAPAERDPAPGAVAAVHRAAIHHQEQRSIPVLVHDRARGPVGLLADGVLEVARGVARLRRRRDDLHPHRTGRVARVHQRSVVGGDADPRPPLGQGEPKTLPVGERDDPAELLRGRERVPLLPAPVAPVRFGHAGEELSPDHRVGGGGRPPGSLRGRGS
jgi:hypothetical protein